MEEKIPGPMTPFDELVTSRKLQILKLLIPYAPASGRRFLAAYIKTTELLETLRLFRNRNSLSGTKISSAGAQPEASRLLASFRPYLNPDEASVLDQILSMKEMLEMLEMLQTAGEDASASGQDGGSTDLLSMLAGMFSPEQQEIYRSCSDMFSRPPDGTQKGEDIK